MNIKRIYAVLYELVKTHSVDEPGVELKSSPEGTTMEQIELFQTKLMRMKKPSEPIFDC